MGFKCGGFLVVLSAWSHGTALSEEAMHDHLELPALDRSLNWWSSGTVLVIRSRLTSFCLNTSAAVHKHFS
jgi:hypothetical protein